MNEPEETTQVIARPAGTDCLAGGGEMGALMRSFDWSKTKLGAVSTWPQSLRTAVSIMLDSAFAMVIAWGPDFVFLYNDRYRPVLGSTKHPGALGRPAKEIFPEVWHFIGPLFEKTRRGQAVALDDVLIPLDRNGYLEDCYFMLSYSPIRDESGGVGGMLAVVAETTERVQDERRLGTLRDLAALAEARNADDACSQAERVLSANATDVPFSLLYLLESGGSRARLAGLTGLARDSAAAAPALDLTERDPWRLRDCHATRETIVLTDLRERFGQLPGGPYDEPTHTAVVLPMLRAGHDQPHGFLVAGVSPRRALDDRYRTFFELGRDHIVAAISNALAYQEQRRRSDALAEIDRAKTAFFSNVSHEFRTPLTLMLGPTEDALASAEQALRGEDLKTVHRNELRLIKLVNTLLDFSRIEAGRMQACYEATDLAALTTDLASAFRSAIERGGLAYRVDCAPLPEPIYVDRSMWEKIVLNLISNAFKFTFEGGIAVTLRSLEGRVELAVQDTGIGIPRRELTRVFERFHRIEGARSRTHEGSGIGLALVNDLVKLHAGEMRVDSEVDRGTTFTVSILTGNAHLPPDRLGDDRLGAGTTVGAEAFVAEALRWLTDAPARPAASLTSPMPKQAQDDVDSARILVVDDNSDMREYLARLLGQRWAVQTARDGVDALALARAQRPDLILSDAMMPNLDGFGLLRELRADPRTAKIPFIVLSARAGEESRIEGLNAGADDYLIKPFSARELIARVSAHLKLATGFRAVELERSNLARLFNDAPVAIAITEGPEHRFVLSNPKHQEIVGRDVIGQALLESMPELRGQPVVSILDRVYATGEPFAMTEMPAKLMRNDQLVDGWFNVTFQPMRDVRGHATGVLMCAIEVTDQVVVRNRFDLARKQAEAANRAKDEFLAMLGHELRNPLAPMLTALHLMRLRGSDKAEKERTVIERQAHHLVRLVDDLLDVSRITRGKVELKKQPLELAEVVARAIEMASPLLEQRQQHLVVDVAPHGLVVHADPERMAQVISNLLTNAAKYTENGGHITVAAAHVDDEVVVRVRDTGIGISAEMLPQVFDMFVQERQALDRSQGGLGLGLAIVRSLVALHNGSVEALSHGRNKGSEFIVRVPAMKALEAVRDEVPQSRTPQHRATADGRRVLVVDDNEDAADILAMSLEMMGHTARVAHDGPSALKLIDEFPVEIALLDIGLPAMDGYELARRLRQHPGLENLKLVAVTGYGQDTDRQRSRIAGFDAHLVKPIKPDDLESVIKELTASTTAA